MYESPEGFNVSLEGLSQTDWLRAFGDLVRENGDFGSLGPDHFTAFVRQGNTLVVSFETIQGINTLSATAQPLAFDMMRQDGWSVLCLISDGDTWYRDARVFSFFDELSDNGFFDEFERIIFYGAGPGGYAAAAYSVAAPGATVVAIQPQATLDPDVTGWDPRFVELRRLDFGKRFGFAPDMIDAAARGYVLYDPREEFDAMHAALFRKPHVERLALPHLGAALQTSLLEMGILHQMLRMAADGSLTRKAFYGMYRARREYSPYLRALMSRLDHDDRTGLNKMLCRNVVARLTAPKFQRRLDALERGDTENVRAARRRR